MPTLTLQAGEVEAFRKIIVEFCGEQDVVVALQRYPGSLGPSDLFPNRYTRAELIDACLNGIEKDNAYHKLSFMLRLSEQGWTVEAFRASVARALPTLVRPPRGFAGQIASVAAALVRLAERLPPKPDRTNVVDLATFERLCGRRETIERLASVLEELEALKTLHDGLHMLKVMAADWLDGVADDPDGALGASTVLALLQTIPVTAGRVRPFLSNSGTESCGRCATACATAAAGIAADAPESIAFARGTLVALLLQELPLLDSEMFRVSRDLPLKDFLGLLLEQRVDPAVIAGREAALDMADTLRRRLMEHALWQVQDARLYAAAQALDIQGGAFLDELRRAVVPAIADLRVLLDRADYLRFVAPMNDAMLGYALYADGTATQAGPGGGALPGEDALRNRIEDAFASLRVGAQTAFLTVDGALRQDLSALLSLKADLRALLDRVPSSCAALVEVYRDQASS